MAPRATTPDFFCWNLRPRSVSWRPERTLFKSILGSLRDAFLGVRGAVRGSPSQCPRKSAASLLRSSVVRVFLALRDVPRRHPRRTFYRALILDAADCRDRSAIPRPEQGHAANPPNGDLRDAG